MSCRQILIDRGLYYCSLACYRAASVALLCAFAILSLGCSNAEPAKPTTQGVKENGASSVAAQVTESQPPNQDPTSVALPSQQSSEGVKSAGNQPSSAASEQPTTRQTKQASSRPKVARNRWPDRNTAAALPPSRRRKKLSATSNESPKGPPGSSATTAKSTSTTASVSKQPRLAFTEHPSWAPETATRTTFWWDELPRSLRAQHVQDDAPISNILKSDYVGAEKCKSCHTEKYNAWSKHPHRWMNATADKDTVLGNFSGNESARIQYRGGICEFETRDGEYRMSLRRDDIQRVYAVNRTIGSRFQQYYVGKLVDGPEPDNHPTRKVDHVLPFGYWIDKQEWVPVVHVDLELPDSERHDPFRDSLHRPYDRSCASCHTTQPAGDRLLRSVGRARTSAHAPHRLDIDAKGYLRKHQNQVFKWAKFHGKNAPDTVQKALSVMDDLPAEMYAADLGITCEACHNGSKAHAERETTLPRFFPSSEHVVVQAGSAKEAWGRNVANANWTCAQCHTGGRSMFACGASTWNSTEYSDALRGACYNDDVVTDSNGHANRSLTCIHCHDPHSATGKKWTKTPEQDDESCLKCHEQLRAAENRAAHTHHPAGSSGDRCMNCHMPKINEGMQDVVRTHMIFSPTDGPMLESNHPNACNLCHLDQNIEWTLDKLTNWYGLTELAGERSAADSLSAWSRAELTKNYRDTKEPVGIGWLHSSNEATRLVAIEALAKANARWALPEMLNVLDDPFLLNRQFAQQRLEEMLESDLRTFGYRHYQYADERKGPIAKIRAENW